jgi:hypothetical protein
MAIIQAKDINFGPIIAYRRIGETAVLVSGD